MIFELANLSSIPGVLALQEQNLFKNLSHVERKEFGFVTTPFSTEQLQEIISLEGLFVGKSDDKIIGYAFAGTWDYFEQWPIFPYMVSRFPKLHFQGEPITRTNSFQYGPVCLDREFRGRGWFNHLFESMRLHWCLKFPLSVTFINQENPLSVAAHTRKLGWTIVDEFEFNTKKYYGLALDMKRSVL